MGFSKLTQTNNQLRSLETMSVALVGLGALGSEIARLLGLMGFGYVALVDNGKIESVNLSQNIFFREKSSVGQFKAEVIERNGFIYFPQTQWKSFTIEVADVGFKNFANCSLIFSATDSALSRVETAYVARRLKIPMIDAGLLGSIYWRGRAAWFSAENDAACYFCQLNETRRAEVLSLAYSPALSCRWTEENLDASSTPTMSSVVAGMAMDLALHHGLTSKESRSFAWDIDLGAPPRIEQHRLTRSSTCPFHCFLNTEALIELPYEAPLCDSLQMLHVDAIELDWPIAVSATCLHCQNTCQPMRRIAWARRHLQCQECGGAHFRFQTICRIAANTGEAQYSPADLSYSKDHLYTPVYHNDRKQS
jgi:molybdopterin/thiamine biosynthesis adenylyltransferase